MSNIHLGLGLIGIGRVWGHQNAVIPSEKEALDLLSFAYRLGILYFDTAPSYGSSEERLGTFLNIKSVDERKKLIIATKFGEHWNKDKNEAYTDQSFAALKQSLDNSIKLLKKIDVLYLHKTTLEALKSNDVKNGFSYAQSLGIKQFGASVSDIESAEYVCNSDFYSFIQFPFNLSNRKFEKIIDLAKKKNKTIVINRPFSMGELLYLDEYKSMPREEIEEKAYKLIVSKDFNGYILTGTKNKNHLAENMRIFSHLPK